MSGQAAARAVVEAVRLDLWSTDEIDRRVETALARGVGGFVLFGGEFEAVGRLTARVRAAAGRDLWIAADLERGAGQQFRGLTELPPPAALAHHDDPLAATERAARITASEALSVGVNWVLAPVLDIDVERDNPIIATRSFGPDPALVTSLGRRWIEICQETGALACAKHFPGHGRTLTDSHAELPVIDASLEELEDDLTPFRMLHAGVGSIMVAHVAYPALGSARPATLSPAIVTDLLRQRIGFEGLVATDAMIMAGVGEEGGRAAVGAMRAGCDVILYPADLESTVEALAREAADDPAFARRLESAVERSERLLERYRSPEPAPIGRGARGGRGSSGGRPSRGDPHALELAVQTIVDRAGDTGMWDRGASTSVVAVSDDPELGPPAGREGPLGSILAGRLRSAGWSIRPEASSGEPGSEPNGADDDQVIVVLAATPRGWKGHGGISPVARDRVRAAIAGAPRALLVLLGHARWLDDLGYPGLGAWSTESLMEHAAAAWLDRRIGRGAPPAGESAP